MKKDLFGFVDYNLMDPSYGISELIKHVNIAYTVGVASVSVPLLFMHQIMLEEDRVPFNACISYPFGFASQRLNSHEMTEALEMGASEFELYINRSLAKDQKYSAVTDAVNDIKSMCGERILKAAFSVDRLTDYERLKMYDCISQSGADYVTLIFEKLDLEHVSQAVSYISPSLKIKISAPDFTHDTAEQVLSMGIELIGVSDLALID